MFRKSGQIIPITTIFQDFPIRVIQVAQFVVYIVISSQKQPCVGNSRLKLFDTCWDSNLKDAKKERYCNYRKYLFVFEIVASRQLRRDLEQLISSQQLLTFLSNEKEIEFDTGKKKQFQPLIIFVFIVTFSSKM